MPLIEGCYVGQVSPHIAGTAATGPTLNSVLSNDADLDHSCTSDTHVNANPSPDAITDPNVTDPNAYADTPYTPDHDGHPLRMMICMPHTPPPTIHMIMMGIPYVQDGLLCYPRWQSLLNQDLKSMSRHFHHCNHVSVCRRAENPATRLLRLRLYETPLKLMQSFPTQPCHDHSCKFGNASGVPAVPKQRKIFISRHIPEYKAVVCIWNSSKRWFLNSSHSQMQRAQAV